MNFEKFVRDFFIPAIRIRKRSWATDERIVFRHILPCYGKKILSSINSLDIEKWLLNLSARGLAESSINRILSVLKAIFAYAHSHGLVKRDLQSVRGCPVRQPRHRSLNEKETRQLWKELIKYNNMPALALRLILLTGCRKNEILKARWENVDLENSILLVPLSKSGRPRYVPLCGEAKRILAKMKAEAKNQWLFPGRAKGKPISDIFHFWNKIRNNLGMGNVRIHDLRHTFASLLLTCGHTLYEAQKILGHADARSTAIYAHLQNDKIIKAACDAASRFTCEEYAANWEKDNLKNELEDLIREFLGKVFERLREKWN